ncbi:MAG: hypothetical protein II807_05280, partial [Thermoguttaceae bacterium]|nr:hypothetical protein [Thermoguttaceae bacterium]
MHLMFCASATACGRRDAGIGKEEGICLMNLPVCLPLSNSISRHEQTAVAKARQANLDPSQTSGV